MGEIRALAPEFVITVPGWGAADTQRPPATDHLDINQSDRCLIAPPNNDQAEFEVKGSSSAGYGLGVEIASIPR